MASHAKRAHLDPTPETPEQTESSSENDSGSEDESNDMEREIQVEFEARTPEERDLPGVVSLLKQCFRGSEDVNLGELAQYVLKQRSVGSVVTQSPSDSTDDEDDDELGKNFFKTITKKDMSGLGSQQKFPYFWQMFGAANV